MSDSDYSKELKYGEPHPAAQHAMVFLRMIPLTELLTLKEAFASTTMSHNRNAEICGETLRRLLDNESQTFRFECAYCGDSSAANDVEFLDSGVQLKCESCDRPTIVSLFTVVKYGRACNVLAGKRCNSKIPGLLTDSPLSTSPASYQ